ncbi:MAG: ArnT family glycosyltransferase [Armatimonadota bacterium]
MRADEAHATPQDQTGPGWLAWADWRATLVLVLGLLALRVIYLVFLCEWELVQDEAHYWEWARRPALSYYSKGPGVAWSIWLSTALFGHEEWAIRLPAAAFSAVGALALARLTIDVTSDERAGFLAAAAWCLVPIYQAEAQMMTIDGPFMACWVLAAWGAWRAFARHEAGERPWGLWALTGLALGVGFLFKYTIVLLPPAFIVYALLRRRKLPWDRRLTASAALTIVAMLAAMSPFLIWNARHGWPALRHELGHLGAPGGDVPTQWDQPFGGFSTGELLLSQVGVIGPPALVLIAMAALRAVRSRQDEPNQWPHRLFLLCSGLVVLGFMFAVSLVSRVEANWPVAGYATLLVLVAELTLIERRRPRLISAWRWTVGFGVFTLSLLMFPQAYARLPVLGEYVPMYRITGAQRLAGRVEDAMELARERTGREPFVAAGSYGTASQLAYYLPGRPTVYGAGRYVGRRGSQYDYFEDTDLTDPRLLGRPAVLVLKAPEDWQREFRFESITQVGSDPPIHVATGYGGPEEPG